MPLFLVNRLFLALRMLRLPQTCTASHHEPVRNTYKHIGDCSTKEEEEEEEWPTSSAITYLSWLDTSAVAPTTLRQEHPGPYIFRQIPA